MRTPKATLDCGCPVLAEKPCKKCCDHPDADDFHCLDCGKDLTEDFAARAEAAADARSDR